MEINLGKAHAELSGSKGRRQGRQHASSSPYGEVKDSLGSVNSEKLLYIIHYILDFGHEVPELLYFTGLLIPATSQIRLHSSLYENPNPHRRRRHEGCDVCKDYLQT